MLAATEVYHGNLLKITTELDSQMSNTFLCGIMGVLIFFKYPTLQENGLLFPFVSIP